MKKVIGFGSSFYQDSIQYSNRESLIQEIEKRYDEEPTSKPYSWEENIHTSIQYGGYRNNLEYFEKSGIPLDLVCLIDEKIQSIILKENLSDIGKFYILEMWYNAYKNGQYQQKHKHSNENNNFFSGVYYIQFDEGEHGATRFYNPYFEIDFDKVDKHPFFVYIPKIKQNDLFVFPSDVGHDVLHQYSSKLRITISFNVSCVFHESNQYT